MNLPYIPNFKNIIFLDIETVSGMASFEDLSDATQSLWLKKAVFLRRDDERGDGDFYFDKAAIYSEFGKIVCISVGILYHDKEGQLNIRIKAVRSDDEKKLLKEFVQLTHGKMNPNSIQLCGHNSKEFDFPYIARRMIVQGVTLPVYLQMSGKKPWETKHIDTMEMWKFGDRKSFTSLALLTEIFGILSPKDDINGSDVNHVYYLESGLERIAHYCNCDVLATAQVYLKIIGLDLIDDDFIHFVE